MSDAKATYEPRTDGLPDYSGDPSTEHLASRRLLPPPDPDHGHSSLPAYSTSLPTLFPIGAVDTPPLVGTYKIESHLRVLGAFHQLRADVLAEEGWGELGDEERWGAYVARAVWRFGVWVERVVNRETRAGPLSRRENPPLDVAMVWHAYCLNPSVYLEDGLTRTKNLLECRVFPLTDLTMSLDPLTMRPFDPPPRDQVYTFEANTSEPFTPPLVIRAEDTVGIRCPSCEAEIAVPWIAADGRGYSQAWFGCRCPSCALQFGKEAMGVRRFCEHAKTWIDNPTLGMPLAGTLIDHATGLPDYTRSAAYNKLILRFFLLACKDKTVPEIGQFLSWRTALVEPTCRTGMYIPAGEATPPRLRRVLSHYAHPGPFAIDLIGATLRQGYFIWKMYDLGWTMQPTFAEDKTVLDRAVARYMAWLDLMSANPDACYVPTLDIDLVWHTHMLFTTSYRQDMHRVLSRIPDHEDKVEENALATGFDETALAWKQRFGVPYAYCGCLLSTDLPPLGLSKLLMSSLFPRSRPTRLSKSGKQLLSSTRDGDSDSSHPSEHDSILVVRNERVERVRGERGEVSRRRREAVRAAAESPAREVWDVLREERHGRRGHWVPFRGVRPGPEHRTAAYLP